MPTVGENVEKGTASGEVVPPNAVSRTVWNWQNREQEKAAHRARHVDGLRRTGTMQGLIGIGIGALMYFVLAIWWPAFKTVGIIAGSIATFILLTAIISPGTAFAGIEKFINQLARGVGVVLTYVMMTPIYFLFFVPFRAFFRGGRKDRMMRQFPDPEHDTFWVDRSGDELTPESYHRQY